MKANIVKSGEREFTIVIRCNFAEAAEVARRLENNLWPLPDDASRMAHALFVAKRELARIGEACK